MVSATLAIAHDILFCFCRGRKHSGCAEAAIQVSLSAARGSLPMGCCPFSMSELLGLRSNMLSCCSWKKSLFLPSQRTVFLPSQRTLGQSCHLSNWRGGILHPEHLDADVHLTIQLSKSPFCVSGRLRYTKCQSTDILLPSFKVFLLPFPVAEFWERKDFFLSTFPDHFPFPITLQWAGAGEQNCHSIKACEWPCFFGIKLNLA